MKKIEINKVFLRNFYEIHKDEYYSRRSLGDVSTWNEQYKWEILPLLNDNQSDIDKITPTTVKCILKNLLDNNPNRGSFTHWTELDNMRIFINKGHGCNILDYVWQSNNDTVGENIDSANSFTGSAKFGPATWGYLLSSKDCDQFALYHTSLMKEMIEVNGTKKPDTAGEKYQLLNDSALYLGSLIQEDKGDEGEYRYTALNGQDFLWTIIAY